MTSPFSTARTSRTSVRAKTSRHPARLTALAAGGVIGMLTLAACGGSSGSGYGSSSNGGGSTTSSGSSSAAGGISTTTTSYGTILTDSSGKTLYAFAADSPGTSNCSGSCLVYWPADPSGSTPPKDPAGVTAKLGTIKRTDGSTQLTVNGWPVYTYVGDKAAGDTTGQGTNLSGGLWWVVGTNGKWIKTTGSSSSSSGGGGY